MYRATLFPQDDGDPTYNVLNNRLQTQAPPIMSPSATNPQYNSISIEQQDTMHDEHVTERDPLHQDEDILEIEVRKFMVHIVILQCILNCMQETLLHTYSYIKVKEKVQIEVSMCVCIMV